MENVFTVLNGKMRRK